MLYGAKYWAGAFQEENNYRNFTKTRRNKIRNDCIGHGELVNVSSIEYNLRRNT